MPHYCHPVPGYALTPSQIVGWIIGPRHWEVEETSPIVNALGLCGLAIAVYRVFVGEGSSGSFHCCKEQSKRKSHYRARASLQIFHIGNRACMKYYIPMKGEHTVLTSGESYFRTKDGNFNASKQQTGLLQQGARNSFLTNSRKRPSGTDYQKGKS